MPQPSSRKERPAWIGILGPLRQPVFLACVCAAWALLHACAAPSWEDTLAAVRAAVPRVRPEAAYLAELAEKAGGAPVPEDAKWEICLVRGRRAGSTVSYRRVIAEHVVTLQAGAVYFGFLGTPIRLATVARHVETADGRLLGFATWDDSLYRGKLHLVSTTGERRDDGKLLMTREENGTTRNWTLDFPDGALGPEGEQRLRRVKGLAQGTSYAYQLWDAFSLQAKRIQVEVGPSETADLFGREAALTRLSVVKEDEGAEKRMTELVGGDLETRKSLFSLFGMEVETVGCEKGLAMAEPEVPELVRKLDLEIPEQCAGALEEGRRGAQGIEYELEAVDRWLELPRIPETQHQKVQRVADDRVLVTVRSIPWPVEAPLPYRGDDPAALKFLLPTPHVQSDHELLLGLAREAVGEARDAVDAVFRIETFVVRHLAVADMRTRIPAVQVARELRGDCSEYASLAAGLCRAAGIPARIIFGLKRSSDGDALRPHEWVECHLGGSWIGLDTTGGFDGTHIALQVLERDEIEGVDWALWLSTFRILDIRAVR
ncbi:MAG: lasso peptide biosynthesis protein [Planctomycetes bacterium]|nr:lasso peptide biosynthesis protein [Planctomycetota bacterium]